MIGTDTSVEFRLTGAGWADLVLRLAGQTYTADGVSYTTDVLGDLARAALMIATGADHARVALDGEPMETRLVFHSLLDTASGRGPVSLTVLTFASGGQPDADGDKAFVADCPAQDFAHAVLACLEKAHAEIGGRYEWGMTGFPLSAMRALEAALAVRDLPRPPSDPKGIAWTIDAPDDP